jgi:hypothetical protein
MDERMKTDQIVEDLIDDLFATMAARAPRRPSAHVQNVPDYARVVLPFARLRQRWKRSAPIPKDTEAFASILKQHGVYIFAVEKSFVECQAAQSKIAKALGS